MGVVDNKIGLPGIEGLDDRLAKLKNKTVEALLAKPHLEKAGEGFAKTARNEVAHKVTVTAIVKSHMKQGFGLLSPI